nr:ribosomal protein L7/L12 [Bacilli bacterium]
MALKTITCPKCGESRLEKVGNQYHCKVCQATLTEEQEQNLEEVFERLASQGQENDIGKLRFNMRRELSRQYVDFKEVAKIANQILTIIPDDFAAGYMLAYSRKRHLRGDYCAFLSSAKEKLTDYQKEALYPYIIDQCDLYGDVVAATKDFLRAQGDLEKQGSRLEAAFAQREKESALFANIPRDIFICHSSRDIKKIMPFIEEIENTHGYQCWISERNLPKDVENYWVNIQAAIDKCKCFLVFASRDCNVSPDVAKELDYADKIGKELRIEVRLENIPNSIRLKYFFDGVQWIDGFPSVDADAIAERYYSISHKAKLEQELAAKKEPEEESESEDPLVSAARGMIESGDYDKANRFLDGLLFDEPDSPSLLELKVLAAMRGGKSSDDVSEEAVEAYDRLIQADGDNARKWKAKFPYIVIYKTLMGGAKKPAPKKEEPAPKKEEPAPKKEEPAPSGATGGSLATLVLENAGPSKVETIKVLQSITKKGLMDAKKMADGAPIIVLSAVSKVEAEAGLAALRKAGAQAKIVYNEGPAEKKPAPKASPTKQKASSWAQNVPESPDDDFEFSANGDGYEVSGYSGSGGTVRIPARYNGKSVHTIAICAFEDNEIDELYIPSSIKEIDDWGLSDIQGLAKVDVDPASDYFFSEDGVLYGKKDDTLYLYPNAKPGKSFRVPSNIRKIGDGAFEDNGSLKEILLPPGLKEIGAGAFRGCSELGDIYIPESVTEIGSEFYSSTAGEIYFEADEEPENCDRSWNYDDVEVHFGATLPYGGKPAPKAAPKAAPAASAPAFKSISNDKDFEFVAVKGGYAIKEFKHKDDKSYTKTPVIPTMHASKRVIGIDRQAFWGVNSNVIEVPEGIEILAGGAFGYAKAEVVRLPSTVRYIDRRAFNSDSKELREFYLHPANPYYVFENGVLYTKGKKKIVQVFRNLVRNSSRFVIPDSVEEVEESLLYWSPNSIMEIVIGANLKTIGDASFGGNANLARFEVSPKNKYLKLGPNGELMSKDGKTLYCVPPKGQIRGSYSVPSGVKTIAPGAIRECKQITSLSLPNGLEVIGDQGIRDTATGLTGLPSSIIAIGASALSGCGLRGDFYVPEGCQHIAGGAFQSNRGLTSVHLPASLVHAGKSIVWSLSGTVYCPYSSTPEGWDPKWMSEERVSYGRLNPRDNKNKPGWGEWSDPDYASPEVNQILERLEKGESAPATKPAPKASAPAKAPATSGKASPDSHFKWTKTYDGNHWRLAKYVGPGGDVVIPETHEG